MVLSQLEKWGLNLRAVRLSGVQNHVRFFSFSIRQKGGETGGQ